MKINDHPRGNTNFRVSMDELTSAGTDVERRQKRDRNPHQQRTSVGKKDG
ncbi:MAG: hypothetical protein AAF998_16385 [Bacteroidota bacterium]